MPIIAAELMARVGVDGAKQASGELKQVGTAFDQAAASAKASAAGLNAAEAALKQSATAADAAAKSATVAGTGFASGAKSVLLFGGAAGVGAAAANMLVGGLGSLARGAVDAAGGLLQAHASMEQTEVAFKQLLGSGAAASDMMDDLREMAQQTHLGFSDLAQNARLLLAFGDSAKEVVPHLTAIGDAVSAFSSSSADIDRVVRAIGQMESKGKILAEEMNQLSEIGINGFALLAQETGKTEAELRRLSESGRLLASDYIPLLYQGMERAFGGSMAKQAQTFNGLWAQLTDNIQLAAMEISKPFFDVAKDSLQRFVDYTKTAEFDKRIEGWAEKAEGFAEKVGSFAENEGPELVRTIERMGEVAIPMAANFAAAIKILDDLKVPKVLELWISAENKWLSVMGFAADSVGELADGYGHYINVLTGGQSAQDDANNALIEFAIASGKAAASGEGATTKFAEMAAGAKEAADEIKAAADELARAQVFTETLWSQNGDDRRIAAAEQYAEVLTKQSELVQQQGRDAQVTAEMVQAYTAQQSLAAFATDKLREAQQSLADAYQIGLSIQADYTAQGSEYSQQAGLIEKAMEAVNRKIADGSATAEDYAFILEHGEEALGRLEGGMDDAAITAGEYAVKNGLLMKVQDEINKQYPHLVAGSEEYNEKLRESALAAGISATEFDNLMQEGGGLYSALAGPDGLTGAVRDLIAALEDIFTPDVDVNDKASSKIDEIVRKFREMPTSHTITVDTVYQNVGAAPDFGNTGGGPMQTDDGPTDSGSQPQGRSIPGIGPESLAAAKDSLGNAQQYANLVAELTRILGDIAKSQAEGLEKTKEYVDLASSALGVFSDAVEFARLMGDQVFLYGDWQAANVDALKRITEKAVSSLGDSAALFTGKYLEHTQAYADAAQTALGVMSAGVEFVEALGDTVVLWGDWQAQAIANLKFIAEKATASVGDSAQLYSDEYLESLKQYATGAEAALGVMGAAVSFVRDLTDASAEGLMSTRELVGHVSRLADQTRLIADEIADAAEGWDKEISPDLADYADAVSSASGGLSDTLAFIIDLNEGTENAGISTRELAMRASHLAAQSRVLADAYATAAKGWDAEVNPAVEKFAEAAGNSLDVMAAVPEVLEALLKMGDKEQALDVDALSQSLVADVKTMVGALVTIADDWDVDAIEALGKFADGAGKGLSLMGDAASAMTAIADMGKLSQKQLDIFHDNFMMMLEETRQLVIDSREFLGDVLEFQAIAEAAAAAWSAAAAALGSVGGAIDVDETGKGILLEDGSYCEPGEPCWDAFQAQKTTSGGSSVSHGGGPKGGPFVGTPLPPTVADPEQQALDDLIASYIAGIDAGTQSVQGLIDTLETGGQPVFDAVESQLQSMASTLVDDLATALLTGSDEADELAAQLQTVQGVLESLEQQAKETGSALAATSSGAAYAGGGGTPGPGERGYTVPGQPNWGDEDPRWPEFWRTHPDLWLQTYVGTQWLSGHGTLPSYMQGVIPADIMAAAEAAKRKTSPVSGFGNFDTYADFTNAMKELQDSYTLRDTDPAAAAAHTGGYLMADGRIAYKPQDERDIVFEMNGREFGRLTGWELMRGKSMRRKLSPC